MEQTEPNNIYVYIFIMAAITYMLRVLPLTLIKTEIRSPFMRSFLHYVPYATISAMTFPAILTCTRSIYSAITAFIIAIILSYKSYNMIIVALISCLVVYITELFIY